jgi:hypothetical protein
MCAYVVAYPAECGDALVNWIRCQAEADDRPCCVVEPRREARLRRWLAFKLVSALECGYVGVWVSNLDDLPSYEYPAVLLRRLLVSENLRHVIDNSEDLRGLEIPMNWQTWRMDQGVSYDEA